MLGYYSIAEIMAHVGFDWLVIDGEHAALSLDSLRLILQAMNGSETVPILRVPSDNKDLIKLALDIGVKGIMVPMVCSRQEATDVVQFCIG